MERIRKRFVERGLEKGLYEDPRQDKGVGFHQVAFAAQTGKILRSPSGGTRAMILADLSFCQRSKLTGTRVVQQLLGSLRAWDHRDYRRVCDHALQGLRAEVIDFRQIWIYLPPAGLAAAYTPSRNLRRQQEGKKR